MTKPPTPYPDLNAVLRELVISVRAALSDIFVGSYLHGSFATGGFDRDSDVDFVIAIEHELSEAQLHSLQATHARIHGRDSYWAQHLEGSYFPRDVLKRHAPVGGHLWYLDNGSRSLIRSDHDDTVVVRWTLREHGVVLAGPSPTALIDPIPVLSLLKEVVATMRNWGQQLLTQPDCMNNRWYQPFAVLSYCRMMHTLQTGTVGSKPAAVQWAKEALDARWAGLIQRAWDERPNQYRKILQPADPDDFRSTQEFIKYAIIASEHYPGDLPPEQTHPTG
jgi:predicted nucleotidyltransferase